MRFTSIQREQLLSLQKRQDELRLSSEAKQRLEWLIYFVDHGRSISKTCNYFAIARTTLQRWLLRFDPENPFSLEERSHRSLQTKKPFVSHHLMQAVAYYHQQYPHLDKKQLLQILAREQGVWMSVQELDYALAQVDALAVIAPLPAPLSVSIDRVQQSYTPAQPLYVPAPVQQSDAPIPQPAQLQTSSPITEETDVSTSLQQVQTSVSTNTRSESLKTSQLFNVAQRVLHKASVALSLVAIGWLLASHQLSTFAHDIRTQATSAAVSVFSAQTDTDTSSSTSNQ